MRYAFAMMLCLTAWAYPQVAVAKLMLFGGSDHKTYLGCIDCGSYVSDSICNDYGPFGNEYSSRGIFNEYSGFGNEYASESPWNEHSSSKSVPALVDENGAFYGYFTINEYRSDAVAFAPQLKQLHDRYDGDLEKVRKALCEALDG